MRRWASSKLLVARDPGPGRAGRPFLVALVRVSSRSLRSSVNVALSGERFGLSGERGARPGVSLRVKALSGASPLVAGYPVCPSLPRLSRPILSNEIPNIQAPSILAKKLPASRVNVASLCHSVALDCRALFPTAQVKTGRMQAPPERSALCQ